MQKILGYMRAAVHDYNMIDNGDNIAVGVSGGKDSVLLLDALVKLSRFYPKKFTVTAITIDPCFDGKNCGYSEIQNHCDNLGIKYILKRTDIGDIVFNEHKENNPCSICSKLRNGILHKTAAANGCNKIALGHHMDDAAQTMLMNLLNGGRIKCFSPASYLSRRDLYIIRPLIYVKESDIEKTVARLSLPVVKSACPADGNTERQKIKELIASLDADYAPLAEKITGALKKAGISRW